MPIIRDIGVRGVTRFTDLSLTVKGITRRLLSIRLLQLSAEGLIEKQEGTQNWRLTSKGKDLLSVLTQLAIFRIKWDSNVIFADKPPYPLAELT